jgi:hypothetical protein
MIRWVETPYLPIFLYVKGVRFIRNDRISYNLTRSGLYLYLSILQDLSINYLTNRLDNGHAGLGLQAKGADSWRIPCSFSLSSVSVEPM